MHVEPLRHRGLSAAMPRSKRRTRSRPLVAAGPHSQHCLAPNLRRHLRHAACSRFLPFEVFVDGHCASTLGNPTPQLGQSDEIDGGLGHVNAFRRRVARRSCHIGLGNSPPFGTLHGHDPPCQEQGRETGSWLLRVALSS